MFFFFVQLNLKNKLFIRIEFYKLKLSDWRSAWKEKWKHLQKVIEILLLVRMWKCCVESFTFSFQLSVITIFIRRSRVLCCVHFSKQLFSFTLFIKTRKFNAQNCSRSFAVNRVVKIILYSPPSCLVRNHRKINWLSGRLSQFQDEKTLRNWYFWKQFFFVTSAAPTAVILALIKHLIAHKYDDLYKVLE